MVPYLLTFITITLRYTQKSEDSTIFLSPLYFTPFNFSIFVHPIFCPIPSYYPPLYYLQNIPSHFTP